MADDLNASEAAAELAEAAGRSAADYTLGDNGDSDGPDLDAVNETLGSVFDMQGIVPGPSWSSQRPRRRGRRAAATTTAPPPRRGQQRQRRGATAAAGKANGGTVASPGQPQPGPSRGRGGGGRGRGRRRIANRPDLDASSTGGGGADRGEDGGDAKATEDNEVKAEDVKSDDVKAGDVKSEDVKAEDVKSEDVKAEDDTVKAEDDQETPDIDDVQETVEIGSSNSNSCQMVDDEEDEDDEEDDGEYDLEGGSSGEDDEMGGLGLGGLNNGGQFHRGDRGARAEAAARAAMMNDNIKKKMENMFKTSLDLADDEGYMEACEGVTTRLYPHQMRALYWMAQRENKFHGRDGVTGGILADDMGLGKTLSVISLVMTNFHDERPLGRPVAGYSRAKNRTGSVIRYMPVALGCTPGGAGARAAKKRGARKGNISTATVQAKLNSRKGLNLFGFGGKKKDLKGKAKSSGGAAKVKASKPINFGDDNLDYNDSNEEEDEFGSMCNDKSGSLSERLSGRQRADLFAKPERRFFDGLSDDEEYMAMSEKERDEAAKRGAADDDDDFGVVNLDGAAASPEASDEDEEDEFGAMCNEKSASLSQRLGLTPSPNKGDSRKGAGLFATHRAERQDVTTNGAASKYPEDDEDDEIQPLSKKLKRKVAKVESDSEEDEDQPLSKTVKRGKVARVESGSDEDKSSSAEKRVKLVRRESSLGGGSSDEVLGLPDLNDDDQLLKEDEESASGAAAARTRSAAAAAPELSEEQRAKLVSHKREPPKLDGRRKTTLIVTPASLISHWLQQIDQHVDDRVDLKVGVHHGTCRVLTARELEDYDIVLTTYGTMMAELSKGTRPDGPLIRARWLRVVLDEGHYIKNHLSKTHKAAAELDTRRKWLISGTPIQNNLRELWSLLKWLEYEPYASHRPLFRDQIEQPVKNGDPRGVARLQTIVKSITLRRTKTDQVNGKPLVNLPTKTITVTELEFTGEERAVYDAYIDQGREIIMRYIRRGTLMKNYAHVFAVMVRLRQLCCHRELLPVNWMDVDMDQLVRFAQRQVKDQDEPQEDEGGSDDDRRKALAEQLRELIKSGASDECSICLSEFRSPVITLCAHVYCRPCITQHIQAAGRQAGRGAAACPLCRAVVEDTPACLLEAAAAADENDDDEASIGGAIKDESRTEFEDITVDVSSTKINAVLRELEISKAKGNTDKTIVVSQFTKVLSIIQPLLDDAGHTWTRLDGSMTQRERTAVIAEFQDPSPDSPRVLLLSLRAGGVGLNLTAANKMVLIDPAWNPATEDQCFDRIHRLGQTRDCKIVKFIHKNSIEERMMAIQEKKKNLISGAFQQTAAERRNQRIQDIRDIFGI